MANRGSGVRAKRRRAKALLANQTALKSTGVLVESREDSSKIAETQSVVTEDLLHPWLPDDLDPDNFKKEVDEGRGKRVQAIKDRWLDIRAVNENWPISRQMRERMAFEAMQTALSPEVSIKERLLAKRLLLIMDAQNKPTVKGLPSQVDVKVETATGEVQISVRQVLDAMDGILDLRDYKIEPNSPDDYAS